jgi:phosphopantetheinyl transferase
MLAWRLEQIEDLWRKAENCPYLNASLILHPARRKAALCGEYLARQMLAECSGLSPASFRILRTPQGKPYAEGLPFHFNLSHSGPFLVCAVATHPVGVDIEVNTPPDPRLARRLCTPSEQALLQAGTLHLLELWTAKEAYFKAIGSGITDLQSIDYRALLPRLQRIVTKDYILSFYN